MEEDHQLFRQHPDRAQSNILPVLARYTDNNEEAASIPIFYIRICSEMTVFHKKLD